MSRKKGIRKIEFGNLSNTFRQETKYRGRWAEWFGNDNPITLELGCGKGEVVLGLAEQFTDRNLMGIDLKSDRLWVGATIAEEKGLKNIAFHRLDVFLISEYYGPGEISEFWITFPDPYPKDRHEPRRLPNVRYLSELKKVAAPEAIVHFKTDNIDLFEWTLEHYAEHNIPILAQTRDLHSSELLNEETGIRTSYEDRFFKMGLKINYLKIAL